MLPDFTYRQSLTELMDDPAADERLLFNTYRQFAMINRLYCRWRTIYDRWLRPALRVDEPRTLLDVGFGGGDIPRALARWARRDGVLLHILAIDQDPRALKFVRTLEPDPDVEFQTARLEDVVDRGEVFDFTISNAVLHHLEEEHVRPMLERSAHATRRMVIMNDLVRSAVAYAFFSAVTPWWFHDSFTLRDGRTSLRRSFRPAELRALAPDGWTVQQLFPYRQLLVWRP